jgi:branched-chain amino acid transport system permease protein
MDAMLSHVTITLRPPAAGARVRNTVGLAFWIGVVAAGLAFPERMLLLNQVMIAALFALSLDLLLGYAGVASLGQAAFFGTGAYSAGLLAKHGWQEPLTGLLVAGLAAGCFGFLCSLILARLKPIALFTVTLGIVLLVYELANKLSFITGGEDGLQGIAITPIFGVFEFDFYGTTAFWYSAVVTFAVYLGLRHLVQTPFGLSLRAIRENPGRVQTIGISVRWRTVAAFTISAVLAGIAGALLAQTTQFVALEVLSFARSTTPLFMIILGGVGTLSGPLIGSALYIVSQDRLAALSPDYWYFWLGLMLIGIVLLGRGGVIGWLERVAIALKILGRPS